MNLVRLGHYFTPSNPEGHALSGSCRTALVCGTDPGDSTTPAGVVNLAVFEKDGELLGNRQNVPVTADPREWYVGDDGMATFHLSADCPWKR